jgi:hypothetical protein
VVSTTASPAAPASPVSVHSGIDGRLQRHLHQSGQEPPIKVQADDHASDRSREWHLHGPRTRTASPAWPRVYLPTDLPAPRPSPTASEGANDPGHHRLPVCLPRDWDTVPRLRISRILRRCRFDGTLRARCRTSTAARILSWHRRLDPSQTCSGPSLKPRGTQLNPPIFDGAIVSSRGGGTAARTSANGGAGCGAGSGPCRFCELATRRRLEERPAEAQLASKNLVRKSRQRTGTPTRPT